MTDGQWLFTLFALLYLLECLRWQPGTTWLVFGQGVVTHLRRPLLHLEAAGGHLLVLPLFPPLPVHHFLSSWSLLPTDHGLEVLDAHGAPLHLIPWPELKPVADGCQLRLGPGIRHRLPTEAAATVWQQRLTRWLTLPPNERENDFLHLAAASLDPAALDQAMQKLATQTQTLRWVANLIFVWCFGVISSVYRVWGDGLAVLGAAAGLWLLLCTQAVLFWRACGRRPTGIIRFRFWKTLAIAFLPQHAIRAADHFVVDLPHEAHPLAAAFLFPTTKRRGLLSRSWKAIHHGQAASKALQERAFLAFLQSQNISAQDLEERPDRQSGSMAYCPRCQAQFREVSATCQDCGGISLTPF